MRTYVMCKTEFHAHVQSHNQGSEISLRGLLGHLTHTVTFLVYDFLSQIGTSHIIEKGCGKI